MNHRGREPIFAVIVPDRVPRLYINSGIVVVKVRVPIHPFLYTLDLLMYVLVVSKKAVLMHLDEN